MLFAREGDRYTAFESEPLCLTAGSERQCQWCPVNMQKPP